jgi:hypothetical protein
MSLQIAAEHLASKGRGPDTTLVHMSHGEVKSLQDIAKAHGGSLTVNPSTGLPEAGFLSSILPMVAGAALMGVSGGAINPMTAGLLVGGGSMLLNPRQSLGQGLMAGLSAYSGAGLGQALAQQGMMAAAGVPEAAKQVGALTAESTSAQVAAAQQAAAEAAAKTSAAQTAFRGGDLMANAGTMGKGIASLGQEGGMSAFVGNLGGPMKAAMTGAQVAAPLVMQSEDRTVPVPQVDRDPGQQYTYYPGAALPTPEPNIQGRENAYYSGGYRPKTTTAMPNPFGLNDAGRMMADGGAVGWPAGESVMRMADGGISDAHYNLGGYSDGGRLLRGPGDGVSDSIPATIGEKQPARLADGEFVVPARIVSELGNGSTEAGARKLYAMMDRVQGARASTVGKGKVAKNSKADKHLPA